jgi:hypothetical protein
MLGGHTESVEVQSGLKGIWKWEAGSGKREMTKGRLTFDERCESGSEGRAESDNAGSRNEIMR